MVDRRKQAVSIRLGSSDIRKVKNLAERLGVRDSDVIRCALRWMLTRISPLCDPAVSGRSLVPVFVEAGSELIPYFDLDAFRLEAIINGGADEQRRVDHEDIVLLAMSGTQQPYLRLRLSAVAGEGEGDAGQGDSLRQYLYEKYVYRANGDGNGSDESDREAPPAGDTVVQLVVG
jgi:hypothetical protein